MVNFKHILLSYCCQQNINRPIYESKDYSRFPQTPRWKSAVTFDTHLFTTSQTYTSKEESQQEAAKVVYKYITRNLPKQQKQLTHSVNELKEKNEVSEEMDDGVSEEMDEPKERVNTIYYKSPMKNYLESLPLQNRIFAFDLKSIIPCLDDCFVNNYNVHFFIPDCSNININYYKRHGNIYFIKNSISCASVQYMTFIMAQLTTIVKKPACFTIVSSNEASVVLVQLLKKAGFYVAHYTNLIDFYSDFPPAR